MQQSLINSYLAGWTDGDGCIHISKTSKLSLKLIDKEPIEFFKTNLNIFNIIEEVKIDKRFKAKQEYRIQIGGKKAVDCLKQIVPFLIEKQNKAKEYINIYEKNNFNCSYLQHTENEFFGWLAGFSEAEGCFSVKKRRKIVKNKIYFNQEPVFELTNTNQYVMNLIVKKLHEYKIAENKNLNVKKASQKICKITNKLITRKESYRLLLGGNDLLVFYQKIYPFMVIKRKKNKLLEGIEVMKNYRRKRKELKKNLKKFYGKE